MKAGVRKVVKYKLNIYSKVAACELGKKNVGGGGGWEVRRKRRGMEKADAVRLTDRPFPGAVNSSSGG